MVLVEILAELAMLVLELLAHATYHSLQFMTLVVMAMFSARYRGKLKARWNCSLLNKIGMVLGTVLYLCAISCVVFFLMSWLKAKPEPKPLLPAVSERAKKEQMENLDVQRAVELIKDWKKARDAKKERAEE